jgi:hypothetical protein
MRLFSGNLQRAVVINSPFGYTNSKTHMLLLKMYCRILISHLLALTASQKDEGVFMTDVDNLTSDEKANYVIKSDGQPNDYGSQGQPLPTGKYSDHKYYKYVLSN